MTSTRATAMAINTAATSSQRYRLQNPAPPGCVRRSSKVAIESPLFVSCERRSCGVVLGYYAAAALRDWPLAAAAALRFGPVAPPGEGRLAAAPVRLALLAEGGGSLDRVLGGEHRGDQLT